MCVCVCRGGGGGVERESLLECCGVMIVCAQKMFGATRIGATRITYKLHTHRLAHVLVHFVLYRNVLFEETLVYSISTSLSGQHAS